MVIPLSFASTEANSTSRSGMVVPPLRILLLSRLILVLKSSSLDLAIPICTPCYEFANAEIEIYPCGLEQFLLTALVIRHLLIQQFALFNRYGERPVPASSSLLSIPVDPENALTSTTSPPISRLPGEVTTDLLAHLPPGFFWIQPQPARYYRQQILLHPSESYRDARLTPKPIPPPKGHHYP